MAPGWFFVMVEPPTSIRFGFDLRTEPPTAAPPPPTPGGWNDLTWDHVIDERGFATARRPVSVQNPPPSGPVWGGSGGVRGRRRPHRTAAPGPRRAARRHHDSGRGGGVMKSHTVVAGDTLWALAQRFYGCGNLYPIIAAANAIPNPDHIEVGQVLSIPDTPLADVLGHAELHRGRRRHPVRYRPTFYGDARLAAVIATVNKIPDPDRIDVGQVLIIPAVKHRVRRGARRHAVRHRATVLRRWPEVRSDRHVQRHRQPEPDLPRAGPGHPGVAVPTRPRSPVSALRRAADAAEIEFDRFDALVNTSAALAAKFGAARDTAKQRLDDARSALAQAIAAEPPIWADAPLVPALLVPVRMEVRYRPNEQQPDAEPALAIRVVPDDIAVHSFEPELTDAERDAAQQYWTTVSVADVTDRDIAAGWTTVLGQLGAARAAWAVEAMHPHTDAGGVLEFPDVGRRASTWTRAATQPAAAGPFRVPGLAARQAGVRGHRRRHPVGPGHRPGPDRPFAPGQHPLGWSAASAWMVDFDEALRVGMGVLVPLTGTDVGFDEIVVVGVSDRNPGTASADLARSLQGHLYTRGLAFPGDACPPTTRRPPAPSGAARR